MKNLCVESVLRQLRREFPPLLPTKVFWRDLSSKDYCGLCEIVRNAEGNRFKIVIHKFKNPILRIHFLIHEWAHSISWQESDEVPDHGVEWGLALSRIYSKIMED